MEVWFVVLAANLSFGQVDVSFLSEYFWIGAGEEES